MTTVPDQQPTADTPLEHALTLAALGIRVLPIRPGSKRPPMNSWQHAATNDPDKIRNWYRGLYKDAGVGIALGDQPNGLHLFAIDLDDHGSGNGHDELADLEREHGKLPDTWRSITGSGNGHLIFATTTARVRNQQAAGNRVAPNIDVRGQGGQIVVAPTLHPDTLNAYAWEHGFEPWTIPVAVLPDDHWLIELVREPDATPAPPPTVSQATSSRTVFDLHRDDWSWHTELLGRGWTHCGTQDADSYWARPGKDRRAGHSAVLHEPDGPFVIFTTEIDPAWTQAASRTADGSGWSFGPFGFYAATRHAGDRSAAARALHSHYGIEIGADIALGDLIAPDSDTAAAVDEGDWSPQNITDIYAKIVDGTYQPETPQHLEVDGAMPLLYPGRVHSIFGEPGGGKTWVSYFGAVERLKAGEWVLFIDWEDSARGAAQRLLQLGCTADDVARFTYINPSSGLPTGWATLEGHINRYSLIVIDSTGESMAASGIDPNADGQVAAWIAYAKMLARGGATVLLVDHVAKNIDNRDMEIGSQRKQAGITGASYRCDTIKSPAKGKEGRLRLVTRKDRLGNRAKGQTAAIIDIADRDDGTIEIVAHISDAQAAADRGERFRPTVLMERVSRWLEIHPASSKRTIRDEVQGNNGAIDTALEVLIEEGYVTVERVGTAHVHRSDRPYRETFDLVDNSTVPIVPNRAPTVPKGTPKTPETERAHRAPVSLYTGHGARSGDEETNEACPPVDNSSQEPPELPY